MRINKIIVFFSTVFFLIFHFVVFAQKEANVWHFGNGQGFDFNSGQAVQITGAMYTNEGCTAYCDSLGNLLFYSNGGGRVQAAGQNTGMIWNANHEVLYDMQGVEGGGFSAAQSSVIIPAPGETDVYYLFTMEEIEHYVDATPEVLAAEPNGRGFRYFKIDMSLNNGLGGVVEADVEIYDYSFEGICAIRHPNEEDYWILINQDSTGIGVYQVTSSGVELMSVYETEQSPSGQIKAAPTGPFGVVSCFEKVYASGVLFDFDRTTGELSNPDALPGFGSEAVEFSSNGAYLYATLTNPGMASQQLVRYNLATACELQVPVSETQEVLEENVTAYYMQLAPDQKIYYTYFDQNFEVSLGTINCVNSENPSITTSAYTFGAISDFVFATLPNFPSWIFYESYVDNVEFGPDTVYLCAGDSLVLDAGFGDYWEWGGDCFSGPPETWPDNATRYFTVTQPGTYSACVNGPCSEGSGADGCDSSDQITVLPCPINPTTPCDLLSLQESFNICIGDTLQLVADLSLFESYSALQWIGGGTFIPSDTVAEPLYVPSAQEIAAGSANLILQVFDEEVNSTGGNFLAYEHSGDDIIFYISTADGSVDTIQSNTGNDWTAMGFSTATNNLYGISNIVTSPALSSVNIETGVVTPILDYPNHQFYAGDFDNVSDRFFVIGIPEINSGEPLTQTLYTVDVNNGALTAVGDLALTALDGYFAAVGDGINGLAYDPSLDLLFAATASGLLLQIDPSNAQVSTIGNTIADLRGLAYDYNANELWGVNANGNLFHINKLTGELIEEVTCQQPLSFVTTLTYALPQNVTPNVCSDNTTVLIGSDIALDLGQDTILCEGETLLLSAPGFQGYQWQDGSAAGSFTITEDGTYTLEAIDAEGCSYRDTINIGYTELPQVDFSFSPMSLLIPDSLVNFTIEGSLPGDQFLWFFQGANPSSSDEISPIVSYPLVPGNYTVGLVIVNEAGCRDSLFDVIKVEYDGNFTLPNIFSPDNDGYNDVFVPFELFPGDWDLTVFNRWGTEIYHTDNISKGWSGDGASTGTYYWVVTPKVGQKGDPRRGIIMLVR